MAAGFPDGTPLRRGVTFAYYRVETIQFLRTTYKAGALPALGIACLGGAGLGALWTRVGAGVRARPAVWRAAAVAGAAGLAALAAWPLVSGRAPEGQLAFSVPAVLARGRARPRPSAATTRARSSSRGSGSPTTAGAGRSTRSCPR